MNEDQSTGDDFQVTPEHVTGKIDYEKLIVRFGSSKIEQRQLDRLAKHSRLDLHPFLTRGFFFSHRDLDVLLDALDKKKSFYLYTGRGPSAEAMHLGHLIPFLFTAWFQRAFDVPVVIQITGDEKYLFKEKTTFEKIQRNTIENVRDIIACGFDIQKTFIFSDFDYIDEMYANIIKIQRCFTYNQVKAVFGLDDSANVGKISFAATQAAPCFPSTFKNIFPRLEAENALCVIPCGIDQDPYFLMARDAAARLGFSKPVILHSRFLPALQGITLKMSSSNPDSAIFLNDKSTEIHRKIMRLCFSGGGATLEEHQKFGANLEVDVAYQYLKFFEHNTEILDHISEEYQSGRMLTSEVKSTLSSLVTDVIRRHQISRRSTSDAVVKTFMSKRLMMG